jgi:hypothetical protein
LEYVGVALRRGNIGMKRSSVGFAFVLLGLLAACGGDDKDSSSTKSNSQGKAGSGATDTKNTKACGSAICKLPKGVTGDLCCKDQFTATCGVMAGGNCRELPKVDDRCPPPDLRVMVPMPGGTSSMTIFGCCTTNNECGIDFGAGCQPRTTACMVVGPDQVDKIKPMTCDGKELPLPAGCGMNMITIPSFAGQSGGN